MNMIIAVAGGVLAAGAAMAGSRPVRSRVKVGREARLLHKAPLAPPAPDEVTVLMENGARYFADGSLVGFWRALRAHRVVEVDDQGVATIEPDWDGAFVAPGESAAAWAERESQKGNFVLGPVLLAYDTGAKRILWSSKTDEPAVGDVFAVVLPPGAARHVRELANQAESGG